jgi:hypothetical protein
VYAQSVGLDGIVTLSWESIPFVSQGAQAQDTSLFNYRFQVPYGPAHITSRTYNRLPTSGAILYSFPTGQSVAVEAGPAVAKAAVLAVLLLAAGLLQVTQGRYRRR